MTQAKSRSHVTEPRKIYSQHYYQAHAILRDPWFIKKLAELKQKFANTGCPLPDRPFKKYAEYEAWIERKDLKYAEILKSSSFQSEKQRITDGSETVTREQYLALEDLEARLLPPFMGPFYEEVLSHFEINEEQKAFRDFFELNIFLGRDYFLKHPFTLKWRLDRKTQATELYIKINGATKKDDILQSWDWIAEQQKSLPDYIGKNKPWEEFERDIEIYNLYKKLKSKYSAKRQKKFWAIDTLIHEEMTRDWPDLTVNQIRSIVSKTRERLGGL